MRTVPWRSITIAMSWEPQIAVSRISSAWRRNGLTKNHIVPVLVCRTDDRFSSSVGLVLRRRNFAYVENHRSADRLEIRMAEFQTHAAPDVPRLQHRSAPRGTVDRH